MTKLIPLVAVALATAGCQPVERPHPEGDRRTWTVENVTVTAIPIMPTRCLFVATSPTGAVALTTQDVRCP